MSTAYLEYMLFQLGQTNPDSVRDASHMRQPLFYKNTRRVSFRIYNSYDVLKTLGEQSVVPTKLRAQQGSGGAVLLQLIDSPS